jgi:hypothetical protein
VPELHNHTDSRDRVTEHDLIEAALPAEMNADVTAEWLPIDVAAYVLRVSVFHVRIMARDGVIDLRSNDGKWEASRKSVETADDSVLSVQGDFAIGASRADQIRIDAAKACA